jgi:hypothetical protein
MIFKRLFHCRERLSNLFGSFLEGTCVMNSTHQVGTVYGWGRQSKSEEHHLSEDKQQLEKEEKYFVMTQARNMQNNFNESSTRWGSGF